MNPVDHWITLLGTSPGSVLIVAILLGLRHATDPDHIAAVSTLVLADRSAGMRRARTLGTAWGLGHGATLLLFGLPVILFRSYLPESARQVAEVAIGVIIVLLAIRLLLRWRRGYFHAHLHSHDGVPHAHPHLHEHSRKVLHPRPTRIVMPKRSAVPRSRPLASDWCTESADPPAPASSW